MGNWLTWFFTHKIVLLTIGGAIGTIARYYLGHWIGLYRGFPLGTFVINIVGSFILGAATLLADRALPPAHWQTWILLIGVGLCGGFTTFSTFELDTFKLIQDGSWGMALLYVLGSVLAGFFALVIAVKLTQFSLPNP